jgi:hypothetical protein
MSLQSRLIKINNNINRTKGLRPVKLEDYYCNNLKNTYIPKIKKGNKRLEDYFQEGGFS